MGYYLYAAFSIEITQQKCERIISKDSELMIRVVRTNEKHEDYESFSEGRGWLKLSVEWLTTPITPQTTEISRDEITRGNAALVYKSGENRSLAKEPLLQQKQKYEKVNNNDNNDDNPC